MQRVDALAGQCHCRLGFEIAVIDHDGIAYGVDAPASGTAGELGVLPRGQWNDASAIVFLQLLHHDAACRHVDAERQCLGGKHTLDEPLFEQALDNLLEQRDHTGMVRGKALFQGIAEL